MIARMSRRDGQGRAALRAFFRLADSWSLTAEEQRALLGVSADDLKVWRHGGGSTPEDEILTRIAELLRIFAAINSLLPLRDRAAAWMRKPNKAPLFDHRSALDLMMSDPASNLPQVRRYLEAQLR